MENSGGKGNKYKQITRKQVQNGKFMHVPLILHISFQCMFFLGTICGNLMRRFREIRFDRIFRFPFSANKKKQLSKMAAKTK